MNISIDPQTLYLSVHQVAERYGVSTDTIWRWVRNGTFPKRYKLGGGTTRWRLADLIEHEATFQVGMFSTLEFHPSFAMVA